MLCNSSAVTARGAIAGLIACLPTLLKLQSLSSSVILSLLPKLFAAIKHKYWLVRLEVCDLLSQLPLSYIDFLEDQAMKLDKSSPSHWGVCGLLGHFSHRVLRQGLLPLLPDTDQRVRAAVIKAICKLLPELMLEGDLYKVGLPSLCIPGYLYTHNHSYQVAVEKIDTIQLFNFFINYLTFYFF